MREQSKVSLLFWNEVTCFWPVKTTLMALWAGLLADFALSGRVNGSLPYWISIGIGFLAIIALFFWMIRDAIEVWRRTGSVRAFVFAFAWAMLIAFALIGIPVIMTLGKVGETLLTWHLYAAFYVGFLIVLYSVLIVSCYIQQRRTQTERQKAGLINMIDEALNEKN